RGLRDLRLLLARARRLSIRGSVVAAGGRLLPASARGLAGAARAESLPGRRIAGGRDRRTGPEPIGPARRDRPPSLCRAPAAAGVPPGTAAERGRFLRRNRGAQKQARPGPSRAAV